MQSWFEVYSGFPLTVVTSFTLIGLAEIGDKSQLVCMALAARYRTTPVLLGAIAAFALYVYCPRTLVKTMHFSARL